MGRNEIKLRRSSMSEGNIARHRDYGSLMKRHRRDLRIRRLTIVLIYVLLIIAVMALFIVIRKDEQRRRAVPPSSPATAQRRAEVNPLAQGEHGKKTTEFIGLLVTHPG